jgi:hypothetical protein
MMAWPWVVKGEVTADDDGKPDRTEIYTACESEVI